MNDTSLNLPWLDPSGRLRGDPLKIVGGKFAIAGTPVVLADCAEGPIPAGVDEILVPGLIDTHVHFRQPGQARKEGVANGCRAALAGGVTTVLEMPNSRPPTVDAKTLAGKRKLWRERGIVDWGLFVGATPDPGTPAEAGIDPSTIAGLKVFLARSGEILGMSDTETLSRLFASWPRVAIHGEDERLFGEGSAHGHGVADHDQVRPRRAILSALGLIEEALVLFERRTRRFPTTRLILLHLSTVEELDWVRRMKARGYDLWAETCPHYLSFTKEDVRHVGARLQVNPPIRLPSDRDALRKALGDGTIDLFSSDHAPHTPAEKAGAKPPSGIPGIERMWPLLARAVDRGWCGWKRALDLAAANPARCYGLPRRGGIAAGHLADLVLLTRKPAWSRNRPFTRAGYDAYEHLRFSWEVESVRRHGEIVFHRGKFQAAPAAEEVYEHDRFTSDPVPARVPGPEVR